MMAMAEHQECLEKQISQLSIEMNKKIDYLVLELDKKFDNR